MAAYTAISADEMATFLEPQGFSRVPLTDTREIVWGRVLRVGGTKFTIRVFSGIEAGTGESRGVGEDAIRVSLVWRNRDGAIRGVGRSKRVHRVAGWRTNLQARIDGIEAPPCCPVCGAPMAPRKSKASGEKFWGCADFPACRGTRPMA